MLYDMAMWYAMIWCDVLYGVWSVCDDMIWYDIWYDILCDVWYDIWCNIWYDMWHNIWYAIWYNIGYDMWWFDLWCKHDDRY